MRRNLEEKYGTGPAARFQLPVDLAVDKDDNVYVAELNSVVKKITPAGVVTTFAGLFGVSGDSEGIGTKARFGASLRHCRGRKRERVCVG